MKMIKWLLWLVLFLVVVAVGGAIFLVTKVDPNDLKPQISSQVESLTGRQLHLGGDLAWQFYPWVGITANDFALSNRAGFAPENMLEAAQVDIQIKLIPLLSKQLEIGKVKLSSPRINLTVDETGATNWGDLAGEGSETPVEQPEQEAGAMLGGLVIQGVDISDGEISWHDQLQGQQYQLNGFKLSTGIIEPGSPVTVQLETGLTGTDIPAPATIKLEASVLLSEAMDALHIEGLSTELGMDQLATSLALDVLDYALADGQLNASGVKAQLADKAQGLEGEFELGSLGFDVNGGLLNIDKTQASVSMQDISADLVAQGIRFALETQLAGVDSLAYTGQYQAYPLSGEVQALSFDVLASLLKLESITASAEYNGVPASLNTQAVALNLEQQTLALPTLVAELGDARFEGGVQVSQLLEDLQASGQLTSNSFNPRALIDSLGLDVLPEMPEQALQNLSLQTTFSGGLNAAALNDIQLKMDQSTLTGKFALQGFEQPAYRFDLQLDSINVDDYLAEAQQAVVEESGGPAAVIALPFAELKGLDVQGQVAIDDFRVMGLVSKDVLVKVGAAADRIEIAPLNAAVYGGTMQNKLVYDISGEVPGVDIQSELLSLNLGPFLRAMQITDRFDGLGTVSAAINSRGLALEQAIANLNGALDIRLNDGAIQGVDIQKSLIKAESAINALSGKPLGLSADLGDKTEFSEFASIIKLNNGVMAIQSIDLKAPAIRVQGGGKVDLVNEQLDINLDVSVVGSFEGQGGQSIAKLKGQTIPMKISGSLDDPSILPDFSKLLQNELEKKISEEYLGGEQGSGESFDDALNRKLSETLNEKLGGEPPAATGAAQTPSTPAAPASSNADIFGSETPAASAQGATGTGNQDIFGEAEQPAKAEPAPAKPKSTEDQLKDQLKGKLLKGLFGN